MSAKKSTTVVSVNWEGLKRFLGWEGSISDLKQVELDRPAIAATAETVSVSGARAKR
jgi:hypothetical protein